MKTTNALNVVSITFPCQFNKIMMKTNIPFQIVAQSKLLESIMQLITASNQNWFY